MKKDSTVLHALETPMSDEGYVIEVNSLYVWLHRLPDHRHARGVRYPLPDVLTLIVLAKLAGEDELAGIAEWVQLRQAWLLPALGLERPRLPHRTTYWRILARAVQVEQLEQLLHEYWAAQRAPTAAPAQPSWDVLIAIDGKTLRGTIPRGSSQGVHLVAAYVPAAGVVLMQVEVTAHANELVAAPRVLACLDLQGRIVTGDAEFTQRGLSLQVLEAGGDYVWPVKANQPQLCQDIERWFTPVTYAPGHNVGPRDLRTAETVDKGHGRLEHRTLTASGDLKGFSDWPGLEQVFKLHRRVTDLCTGEITEQLVYGVTSLTAQAANPARLLGIVRRHWGIESGLFHRRDVTFHEDACRVRVGCAQHALAALNNVALALLLRQGHNVPQVRRRLAAHPEDALARVMRTLH
jgi:predicted transposase YbfD/YdcC